VKLLKILGNGYLALGLFVMLCLFIHDCLVNDKFPLHFAGIFLVIPAIAYCIWRLREDSEDYFRYAERPLNSLRRFGDSLLNR